MWSVSAKAVAPLVALIALATGGHRPWIWFLAWANVVFPALLVLSTRTP